MAHEAGRDQGPCRPTLVACPPHVAEVWFTEVRTWFPDLDIWRFFETKEKVRNEGMAHKTLPCTDHELVRWLAEYCPSDSPRSTFTIVVTAYETWSHRTLKIERNIQPPRKHLNLQKFDVITLLLGLC